MSTAFEIDADSIVEPGFYAATVQSVSRLSPNLVRVVFGGSSLRYYVGVEAPDECVTVYFRPPSTTSCRR